MTEARPIQLPATDRALLRLLTLHDVSPIDLGPKYPQAQVKLGQALFFDPELSGNRDIACATCHHPLRASGDGLALSIGTGTATPSQIGVTRVKGKDRPFIPRNAPEVFNRGSRHWSTQFWDSRVAKAESGLFLSPAGDKLPAGIINVVAAQAMFPVTSRNEMRGSLRDASNPAYNNELAAITDDDFRAIWDALMLRLLRVPGYRTMFMKAYNIDAQDLKNLGFEHAANAIAAFEAVAFSYDDSPFDEYLRGKRDALTESQKRGGILFYGKATCVSCHSGTLLTDQKHYNLAVPQLGPGKDSATGLDFGLFTESRKQDDRFCFRTPPLRNVAVTGPWMHNGAFRDLRSVVRHHLDPVASLVSYNPADHLHERELIQEYAIEATVIESLVRRVDLTTIALSNTEVDDLVEFLAALTAPRLSERLRRTIPQRVPSGLPVAGAPSIWKSHNRLWETYSRAERTQP
jgi:cytochrome c peroxidase